MKKAGAFPQLLPNCLKENVWNNVTYILTNAGTDITGSEM